MKVFILAIPACYCLAFLCALPAQAQQQKKDSACTTCFVYPTLRSFNGDKAISERTYRQIRSQTFGSIAGSQGQGGSLATFCSFDPVAGDFKLNYTQEIGVDVKKKSGGKTKNSVFLSISAGGNLIGNNIGVLFDNSKFSAGTNVTGKLFIPLSNSDIVSGLDADQLNQKKKDLELSRWTAKMKVWQALDLGHIRTNIAYARQNIDKAASDRIALRKIKSSLEKTLADPSAKLLDSLYKISNQLDDMGRDSLIQIIKLDSLLSVERAVQNRSSPDSANYGYRLYKSIDTFYDKRLDALELSIPYQPYTLQWLAPVGMFNRNSYYTYFDSLPYSQQISNGKLSVFNYGLEYNLIHFNLKTMHYLNFGLLRIRNNNIGDLNTNALSRQVKTSENDTTQIVTQNYNVYTSVITEYMAWKPYLNYYLFFGKNGNNQAVHLIGEAEFRDNHQNPVNLGLGYIFSFKNSRDNSVINVEAFVKFMDVFKALPEQEAHFYNHNTIGLQFGLPFNLPSSSTNKTK